MWARIIEFIIAIWLAGSHRVFYHPSLSEFLWISDLFCGSLIALFALFSFLKRFEKIHLCSLIVALWLIAIGLFGSSLFPPPAILQNHLIVGIFLAMFAIIPSQSSRPPRGWRKFFKTLR